MKIPILNSEPELLRQIIRTFQKVNAGQPKLRRGLESDARLLPLAIERHQEALEFLNYQMPPLTLINFSDSRIDGFALVERIRSDPWLNHGGIIALYNDTATYDRVNALQHTNILIALEFTHIPTLLEKVLRVVSANKQILFQRAIHAHLLSTITGEFTLGMDILLVPCYANLVANYLGNVGLADPDFKYRVALVLTELLTNAIEHGNCGIGPEEKAALLDGEGSIQHLIDKRCQDPSIAQRTVSFHYDIQRDRSTYVIRDEGAGFDWRAHLARVGQPETLALHGRGILLARRTADQVQYNENGNEVTLRFTHRPPSVNLVPAALKDSEILECRPEDVIFRQGEESSFLYYVAEGEFRVEVDDMPIGRITPDDMLLGEMSFLLEETRSATVKAITCGRLIKISKESFVTIIKHQPYFGLFLSRLLAQRLHRLSHGILS
jgi:anti-sigma regulatory factor (Ser/Thr protein kinase)